MALAISIAVLALSVVTGILIAACLLLLAAKMTGIEDRSFGRALLAVVLAGLASYMSSLMLSFVPAQTSVLAFTSGFFAQAVIVVPTFRTSFGKALGASLIAWVLSVTILGGIAAAALALAGGSFALP